MKAIFGSAVGRSGLLAKYDLQADYVKTETFFISPKSQFWLQRNLELGLKADCVIASMLMCTRRAVPEA